MPDIARNIQKNYGNIPWMISENGMGVAGEERFLDKQGVVQDDYRIDFMKEHLTALAKGLRLAPIVRATSFGVVLTVGHGIMLTIIVTA